MATINPGIPIKPPFLGQRCDLDPIEVPAGAAYKLRNWLKRDGLFQVRPGFVYTDTLSGRPTGIIQYDHTSGIRQTVIGTTTKWYYYDQSARTWVDLSGGVPLTGSEATHQMFRVFLKSNVAYLVGVNGNADVPKKWDGSAAAYSSVGGSPPKARCMAICNNRMLLGNTYTTQQNPMQVDVSAFNDFEAGWAATQTVNLMDCPGDIVEMREFGNLITVIYKTDSIYLASAQSGLDPFSFQLRWPDIKGPVSPRLVVSTPTEHVFLAKDGSFWRFDGVNLLYLGDPLQAHIRQTADLDMINRGFGFYDAIHQEIWFVYRSRGSGNPDAALVINTSDWTVWPVTFGANLRPTAGYGANVMTAAQIADLYMSIGEMAGTIGDLAHIYAKNILVDKDGDVCFSDDAEATAEDNGSPIDVEMETATVSQDRPTTIVESSHYLPWSISGTAGSQAINIQVGYSQNGEDLSYTIAQVVSANSACVVGHRIDAVLFSLKLTISASLRVRWRGSKIYGVMRGLR